MCSYSGCRNIPMIAKLNAEHDAIVNSSHALHIAHRTQDRETATGPVKSWQLCCTRTPNTNSWVYSRK